LPEKFGAQEHLTSAIPYKMTRKFSNKHNYLKRVDLTEFMDQHANNAEQLNATGAVGAKRIDHEKPEHGSSEEQRVNSKVVARITLAKENKKSVFSKKITNEGRGLNPTRGEIIRLLDIYDTLEPSLKSIMSVEQLKAFYITRYGPARRLIASELNRSFKPNPNKTYQENTAKLRNASFNEAMLKRHEGKLGFELDKDKPQLAVSEFKLRRDLLNYYVPPPPSLLLKGRKCAPGDREAYTAKVRDYVKVISNKPEAASGATKKFSIVKSNLSTSVTNELRNQINHHHTCKKGVGCGDCTKCINAAIVLKIKQDANREKQMAKTAARREQIQKDKNLHTVISSLNGTNGEATNLHGVETS